MWWKILLVIVAIPVALILLVTVIGLFMPKAHTASRRVEYGRPAETVWEAISDFESWPAWQPAVKAMERLDDRDGQPVWRQKAQRGPVLDMQVIESGAPRRMVTKVVDNPMFGGTWTWEIEPLGGDRCALTITEDGEIHAPPFRVIAKLTGYRGTMDAVHRALAAKFGETIELKD